MSPRVWLYIAYAFAGLAVCIMLAEFGHDACHALGFGDRCERSAPR